MSRYVGLYMNEEKQELYKAYKDNNYKLNRSLVALEVPYGLILPSRKDEDPEPKLWAVGGVLNKVGEYVEKSEIGKTWGGPYEYDENDVDEIDEDVLFMGPYIAHWGHYLCDEISRLWYYVQNPGNYKIAYCPWLFGSDVSNYKIDGNFLEILQLIGINREQLISITKPTRFRKVIVPEISFSPSNFYAIEYKELIDAIVKGAKLVCDDKEEKVYFTRRNYTDAQNKEYGEDAIAALFERNGYTAVSPEGMSVAKQIAYYQNSKEIAMISGTLSHNLVFSSPGVKVTILNKMSIENDYQLTLDHLINADISYVDVYFRGFAVLFGAGPFLMLINKYLKKWALDNHYKVGMCSFPIKGLFWYLKKYKEIYSDEQMKYWLKSQQRSLKILRSKEKHLI